MTNRKLGHPKTKAAPRAGAAATKSSSTNFNSKAIDRIAAVEADTRIRISKRIIRNLALACVIGLVRRPDVLRAIKVLKIGGQT